MYIRMLSNNFYFCVYFIFDIIINDLVIYMGSTLRWLRIMNISICNLHISNDTPEFAFSSISGNDNVFRQDTLTSSISSIGEQDCLMEKNVQPFQFSDHDYDSNIDPVNNLYNNVSLNCNYYDNLQFNMLSKKDASGLSIIHVNARSLNANFDNIKDFLQTLNLSFDVITISETSLDVWKISDYELSGNQAFHTIRYHKKGGGVAIYVNKYSCLHNR